MIECFKISLEHNSSLVLLVIFYCVFSGSPVSYTFPTLITPHFLWFSLELKTVSTKTLVSTFPVFILLNFKKIRFLIHTLYGYPPGSISALFTQYSPFPRPTCLNCRGRFTIPNLAQSSTLIHSPTTIYCINPISHLIEIDAPVAERTSHRSVCAAFPRTAPCKSNCSLYP